VTSPTDGKAGKDGAAAESQAGGADNKDKRRSTSFFNFGKKEKKGDSDNEATDGESKPKNKLGGIFRKPSKAVKADKEKETPAEPESKPEPVPKEDPAENKAEEKPAEKPAENKIEENAKPADAPAEEPKPANVPSTSATVEAAA
jgi:outer membrane biosynthesis protein TonB